VGRLQSHLSYIKTAYIKLFDTFCLKLFDTRRKSNWLRLADVKPVKTGGMVGQTFGSLRGQVLVASTAGFAGGPHAFRIPQWMLGTALVGPCCQSF
jgi:hypothetical protein